MRPLLPFLLLPLLLATAGCESLCESSGVDGLSGFQLDCDSLAFHIGDAATRLEIADTAGGQIELEMPSVHTLTTGLRFETGGENDLSGNYLDPDAAIAPLRDAWLEITAWEATDGEAYGQLVAIEFHVEVESTSRFAGGEVDGAADRVPVYSN